MIPQVSFTKCVLLPPENSNRNCYIGEFCQKSKLWIYWPLIFVPVLQQIEAFHEKYNDTRSLVMDVLEQLGEQDVKLSDLEAALGEALDYVTKTEDTNRENTARLQRQEVLCTTFIMSVGCEHSISATA